MITFKPGEIKKSGDMYFIYGDGGTGKTSLSKLFPGKKLLLTFDGSWNALVGTTDTAVMAFEKSDEVTLQRTVDKYLNQYLVNDAFDVIILDNVTALQNFVLENIDGASKDSRQNYQKLQAWFRSLANSLRDSHKTILATAHQIDNGGNGLDGKGRFEADMNQKTFNAFTGPFDVVGRIYKEKGERFIDMDTENGNHAKNRIDDRTLIKAEELLNNEEEKKEEN
ncbi:AAA family ATPase [Fructobacillus fructosus]|uniref:AAA family ATPase n=1 Tax=Fructobacillus fructosus TaxID=1631 RepID=UPI002D8E8F82|nr:hypothetical protein LMG30235_GOPAMIKF_01398 [Fructobacillus fructosus]CAK1252217.1 hypothetical protein LMG30234_GAICNKDF_01472 [Fructobacillus fructosus]